MKVVVVTGLELGWDCVCGVFDPEKISHEELLECFPEESYVLHDSVIETNLKNWKD